MGLRGRTRRLKYFEQRAKAFAQAIKKGQGYKEISRDDHQIVVGTGNHKRLIGSKRHLRVTADLQTKLVGRIKSKNIIPDHYKLVPIESSVPHGVQEYFSKPTIADIYGVLWLTKQILRSRKDKTSFAYLENQTFKELSEIIREAMKIRTSHLNDEVNSICKRFFKANPNCTFGDIVRAGFEIERDIRDTWSKESVIDLNMGNIIALGQSKKDRKIRLAILDI